MCAGSGPVQAGPPEAHVRGGAGQQGGGQQRRGHPLPGAQVQRRAPQVLRPRHDQQERGAGRHVRGV